MVGYVNIAALIMLSKDKKYTSKKVKKGFDSALMNLGVVEQGKKQTKK